jgi:hypothetical protein
MTRLARSFLTLCALLATGCYEYLPARNTGTLLGQRVQLALTDSGAVVMAARIGPSIETVEGDLLADSAGSYVLAVTQTRTRGGAESDWRGEHVVIAHPLVSSFAERRFSRSRSTFAGALMSAGVVAITVGLRGNGNSSGGVPTPGKPTGQ